MALKTTFAKRYLVQTFSRTGRGVAFDPPLVRASEDAAKRSAERLSASKEGVAIVLQEGDFDDGQTRDSTIVAKYGRVPEDFDELFA